MDKHSSTILQSFLQFLQDANYYTDTVKAYGYDIRQFLDYFKTESLQHINHNDLYRYMRTLEVDQKRKNTTIIRKVTALRLFFDYLIRIGKFVGNNPTDDIKRPKFYDTHSSVQVEKKDLEKMIQALPSKHRRRNRALITLMYYHGFTYELLIDLKEHDFDRQNHSIEHGTFKITLHKDVVQALTDYLDTERTGKYEQEQQFGSLFLSQKTGPIKKRTIQHLFSEINKQLSKSQKEWVTYKTLRQNAIKNALLKYGFENITERVVLKSKNEVLSSIKRINKEIDHDIYQEMDKS